MSTWATRLARAKGIKLRSKERVRLAGEKTRSKYGAKNAERAGRRFDSRGEAECYEYLKLLEAAGELADVRQQDTVYLSHARIPYIADFRAHDPKRGEDIWIEFKGFETPEWRLKLKLWRSYGPGRLRLYKGSGLRMVLVEEVIPNRRGETFE
jgi:hypothetical protein